MKKVASYQLLFLLLSTCTLTIPLSAATLQSKPTHASQLSITRQPTHITLEKRKTGDQANELSTNIHQSIQSGQRIDLLIHLNKLDQIKNQDIKNSFFITDELIKALTTDKGILLENHYKTLLSQKAKRFMHQLYGTVTDEQNPQRIDKQIKEKSSKGLERAIDVSYRPNQPCASTIYELHILKASIDVLPETGRNDKKEIAFFLKDITLGILKRDLKKILQPSLLKTVIKDTKGAYSETWYIKVRFLDYLKAILTDPTNDEPSRHNPQNDYKQEEKKEEPEEQNSPSLYKKALQLAQNLLQQEIQQEKGKKSTFEKIWNKAKDGDGKVFYAGIDLFVQTIIHNPNETIVRQAYETKNAPCLGLYIQSQEKWMKKHRYIQEKIAESLITIQYDLEQKQKRASLHRTHQKIQKEIEKEIKKILQPNSDEHHIRSTVWKNKDTIIEMLQLQKACKKYDFCSDDEGKYLSIIQNIKKENDDFWDTNKGSDRDKVKKEEQEKLYIPLLGKKQEHDLIESAKDLRTHYIQNFLQDQEKQCLIIFGRGGSGKSTFIQKLVNNIWKTYQQPKNKNHKYNGWIPVYIPLIAIKHAHKEPEKRNLIFHNYMRAQFRGIQEDFLFNSGRKLLFILDGYDELPKEAREQKFCKTHNDFYASTNKIIITSRPEGFKNYQEAASYVSKDPQNKVTSLWASGFSNQQVEEYLKKYTKHFPNKWTIDRYLEAFKSLPKYKPQGSNIEEELYHNPILLRFLAEVLPGIVQETHNEQDQKKREEITLHKIYFEFIDRFFKRGLNKYRNEEGNFVKDSLVVQAFPDLVKLNEKKKKKFEEKVIMRTLWYSAEQLGYYLVEQDRSKFVKYETNEEKNEEDQEDEESYDLSDEEDEKETEDEKEANEWTLLFRGLGKEYTKPAREFSFSVMPVVKVRGEKNKFRPWHDTMKDYLNSKSTGDKPTKFPRKTKKKSKK